MTCLRSVFYPPPFCLHFPGAAGPGHPAFSAAVPCRNPFGPVAHSVLSLLANVLYLFALASRGEILHLEVGLGFDGPLNPLRDGPVLY